MKVAVMNIVTLTMNPTIDLNAGVEQVLANQKLRCDLPQREPGGGGLNVSRAINNLGGKSLAIFPAGGTHGELLQQMLRQEGIVHKAIPVKGLTRMNMNITERSSAKQYRFLLPGAEISETEWRRCLETVEKLNPKPEYIVASGSLPPGTPKDFYARITRIGNAMNAKVIVDTRGEALQAVKEAGVYLIKPNIKEFEQLVGKEIENDAQLEALAKEVVRAYRLEVIVLSLGAGGACMISQNEITHFRSPTVQIKSRIGAGDSMMAGIVFSLSRGRTLEEAVQYGITAGAAAVMTPGTELCRGEDVQRLHERSA